MFSKSKGAVCCAPCSIFGKTSTLAKEGFNGWKNASGRMKEHENSVEHKSANIEMLMRQQSGQRIDSAFVRQTEEEILYWRAIVKSLASRGLQFRGTEERFVLSNSGNYIMTLELMAEFDPFLTQHTRKYGERGSGSTS